ncbi:MAG: radical SAM protein [Thermodesulfobacteriota bacterium]|nr:radical SAM protein [Thermodesulfobacteriota bacterium]
MNLTVNEIFHSIQGESLFAGLACVFVRLSGCNLNCRYCDTGYARTDEGTTMPLDAILEEVRDYNCGLVAVTGGEPLLQANTPVLINRLIGRGFRVIMETNGSIDIARVTPACSRIVDIKCPGSGMDDKNNMANLQHLHETDQVKFVITDRVDYEFARSTIEQIKAIPAGNILFSPAYNMLSPADLSQWILADRLDVRLHLQLHKTIWGEARGR